MLFNSLAFLGFLAVVLPLYFALGHRWQNRMLLLASYVFYAWWDWRFLIPLWLTTVVDFYVARAIGRTVDADRRRQLVAVSVALNLVYLAAFKYAGFLAASAEHVLRTFGMHADVITLGVLLPVGISFYTFQSISYIIDVYRGEREHTDDFTAYALYVAYFPHLVAGPIQRSTQLLPQLLAPRREVTAGQIGSGLRLILFGYFKKVVIADAVAPIVAAAFATPARYAGPALLAAVYLFAIQIYCDFSGYTDIARGVSRLMGIELRINFRQPYLSASIAEFWRRWHISLSEWFRDYLYIPLGGSRDGRWRAYRNLFITMLLGGLWHGAAWTFVVWGGLHGIYLAVHRALAGDHGRFPSVDVTTRTRALQTVRGRIVRAASIALTFHFVCLAWIVFRASSLRQAVAYITAMTSRGELLPASWIVAAGASMIVVLLLDVPAWWTSDEQPVPRAWPPPLRGLVYGAMAAACLWVRPPDALAFIYFQF